MKTADSATFIRAGSTQLTSFKSEQLKIFADQYSQTCSACFSSEKRLPPNAGCFNQHREVGL